MNYALIYYQLGVAQRKQRSTQPDVGFIPTLRQTTAQQPTRKWPTWWSISLALVSLDAHSMAYVWWIICVSYNQGHWMWYEGKELTNPVSGTDMLWCGWKVCAPCPTLRVFTESRQMDESIIGQSEDNGRIQSYIFCLYGQTNLPAGLCVCVRGYVCVCVCVCLSLSLSLSLTHTHARARAPTHTFTEPRFRVTNSGVNCKKSLVLWTWQGQNNLTERFAHNVQCKSFCHTGRRTDGRRDKHDWLHRSTCYDEWNIISPVLSPP